MAGHRGIEPLLLDLESNVLPLTLMTCGASEEARTLDLLLGKQMFYQLNYTRMAPRAGLEPATNWLTANHSTN